MILLDEPMVGLDPKSARLVKRLLTEFAKKGAAVFMSTHSLEVAEQIAHRIGIIDGGKLIALGTREALCQQARSQAHLEDIFLSLTGQQESPDLDHVLG